jgi:hypothetical protein
MSMKNSRFNSAFQNNYLLWNNRSLLLLMWCTITNLRELIHDEGLHESAGILESVECAVHPGC